MNKSIISKAKQIQIFSDGACSGNPGPGGWGAIIYIDQEYVIELGGGDGATTNNRMEMMALQRALLFLGSLESPVLQLTILTDSKYLIQGLTQWIFSWKKNNWKTKAGEAVANQDLWESLNEALTRVRAKIDWRYVPGHSGVPGNERCDEIAVGFSKNQPVSLFQGLRSDYFINIDDLEISDSSMSSPKAKSSSGKGKKAFCYLSLVHGEVRRHDTWESCQARVHGVPHAKYKKALSAADEVAILKSWGK